MTVKREYTVWCDGDGCYTWERFQVANQSYARVMARREGWACGSHGDYCPDCNTKQGGDGGD